MDTDERENGGLPLTSNSVPPVSRRVHAFICVHLSSSVASLPDLLLRISVLKRRAQDDRLDQGRGAVVVGRQRLQGIVDDALVELVEAAAKGVAEHFLRE